MVYQKLYTLLRLFNFTHCMFLVLSGVVGYGQMEESGTCLVTTVNHDFEDPNTTGLYPTFLNQTNVPGWFTTASDGQIEIWPVPNFTNVPAYSGNQFVELNANEVSGLYQDYDSPEGMVFNYAFAHRGRLGTDTCQLLAGPPGGPYTTVGEQVSTGNESWSLNTGIYVVPENQPITRFIFQSISSVGGGSVGNFLDDISFTANIGILTEGPVKASCEEKIVLESFGQGYWTADESNPSSSVISDPKANYITVSGFTVPGEYQYHWSSIYCSSKITIVYERPFVETPKVESVSFCQGSSGLLDVKPENEYTMNWYADGSGNTLLPGKPMVDTGKIGEMTYYVSHRNNKGCESKLVPLKVMVHPIPKTKDSLEVPICDDDDDGNVDIDLAMMDVEFIGDNLNYRVSYYLRLEDAHANVDGIRPLSNKYTANDGETIYVRVEDVMTFCYDTTSFTVSAVGLPKVGTLNPLVFCDVDGGGQAMFDLEDIANEIIKGDPTLEVTFHLTYEDALNDVLPQSSIEFNVKRQAVFARVDHVKEVLDCSVIVEVPILFKQSPVLKKNSVLKLCDMKGEADGLMAFNLTVAEQEVLNGLDPLGHKIEYYESELDAKLGVDAINEPSNYGNVENPQDIFVRVTDLETGCSALAPLGLEVFLSPIFDLGEHNVICLESEGGETLLDTGLDINDYHFKWSLDGQDIDGASEGFYAPKVGGIYTVQVVDRASGCQYIDTTVVKMVSIPVLDVQVKLDTFLGSRTIEANVRGGERTNLEYCLDNGPWRKNGLFTNVKVGDHILKVRDTQGCGMDSMVVSIMDYPVFFTPNGDGHHDTWNIFGDVDGVIYIFDRYGKLLKQISPDGEGWDGTYNGRPMPSSDYWFAMDYIDPNDGKWKQFKGNFTLKR